jgi:hypothetical protein
LLAVVRYRAPPTCELSFASMESRIQRLRLQAITAINACQHVVTNKCGLLRTGAAYTGIVGNDDCADSATDLDALVSREQRKHPHSRRVRVRLALQQSCVVKASF